MKAAVLYRFGEIRVEEVPTPAIGPGEALMRVVTCGVCSGEVMPWYVDRKAPYVPGHELSGVIIEVGREVETFRPGDRVFAHHHAPCMTCRSCLRGEYVQCETWRTTRLDPGGMAELVRIPAPNLRADTLILPSELSFDDGALIEPVACSVKAFKRAQVRTGETVVVIGLGFMGQVNVILARHYGAGKIIASDFIPFRREAARRFGADVVVDPAKEQLSEVVAEETEGAMADVVIVGPGSIAALDEGLKAAGRGSRVILFTPTPPEDRWPLHPYDLYFREIRLIPSYSAGPDDTREALALLKMKVIPTASLITHRFPLDRVDEAFRLTAQAQNSLKVMVDIGAPEGIL